MLPTTSQSPAVRLMLVMLVAVAFVREMPAGDDEMYSPTLPAFALLFVVVPTMPAVCEGVIVLLNVIAPLNVGVPATVPDSVGEAIAGDVPNTAAPLPVSSDSTPSNCADVVVANCDRLPVVSAKVVPHDRPVPLVYFSALFAVLQLGTALASGEALEPAKLPITVLAPAGARLPATTVDHAGAVLGPVETMACPAMEPDGFSSWTGVVVAPIASDERVAASRLAMILRIGVPYALVS